MRDIILATNISLDGYFSGPGGELDWSIADEELHDEYANFFRQADLSLYGRKTYQMMAEYWPTALSDPNLPRGMADFARAINPVAKIVYSRTLKNPGWNTTVVEEVVPEEVLKLKQQPGKAITLSGSDLAQTFLRYNLVDALMLVVQPVVLGDGVRFFGKDTRLSLNLVESRTHRSGAVVVRYQLAGK